MPLSKIEQSSVNSGVAGTGPSFRAHNNASQSISQSTWTKVVFQVEDWDTANAFNNTGSTVGTAPAYSFNPQVAGYYQVSASIAHNFGGTNVNLIRTVIYKNGGSYSWSGNALNLGTSGPYDSLNVSDLIYLNGSTDYIEVYAYNNSGSPSIDSNSFGTRFSAVLVRTA